MKLSGHFSTISEQRIMIIMNVIPTILKAKETLDFCTTEVTIGGRITEDNP